MRPLNDTDFLMQSFTEDSEKYALLQSFWRESILGLIGKQPESYVSNMYESGQEIMDGNPIISTKVGENGGVRIIQIEQDPEEPIFIVWKNQIQIQNTKIDELVISLQLSQETFFEVGTVIKLFLIDELTDEVIKSINNKYED